MEEMRPTVMEPLAVSQPRIIGIDFGTKRVGLAMTDPLGMFAQPVGTYSPSHAIDRLRDIERDEGISLIIMGWPLTLDGEETKVTEQVQMYINRIAKVFPRVKIEKFDERYSSRRASAALVDAGVGKKARRQKGRLDAAAAALILQDYLDEDSSNL